MGRELNDGDYDVLSQLDHYNNRETTERVNSIVNQLPTYLFHAKQPQPRDQDEATGDSHLKSATFAVSQCSICIEQFEEQDSIKILPCFHQFHAKCADDWLLRKSVCPVCKFDIDVAEEALLQSH